ncbi:hypothetical protein [Crocosphaera watsonii]|uniref:Uncharacterized protein n=1 Tax=Crocosphaera watsonii WH 0003 TaxID=423471 RepID=G5J872_CROWT|nr:hypothetical protein [Crocosphaera watsonii]EHJ11622.1 hypothetical protein CWATWH0003_3656 [Crocosphaera watsonii WH 0003]
MTTIIILDSTPVGLITNPKVISDKGDPLPSPLTPLFKGGNNWKSRYIQVWKSPKATASAKGYQDKLML